MTDRRPRMAGIPSLFSFWRTCRFMPAGVHLGIPGWGKSKERDCLWWVGGLAHSPLRGSYGVRFKNSGRVGLAWETK